LKGGDRKFEYAKQIEEYVGLLNEIEERLGNEALALAILQEIAKDRRTLRMNSKPFGNGATPRQLALLDREGVRYPKDISRLQASILIEKTMQEKKEKLEREKNDFSGSE